MVTIVRGAPGQTGDPLGLAYLREQIAHFLHTLVGDSDGDGEILRGDALLSWSGPVRRVGTSVSRTVRTPRLSDRRGSGQNRRSTIQCSSVTSAPDASSSGTQEVHRGLVREGVCVGTDRDPIFPVGHAGSAPVLLQTNRAKAVCRRCPVRDQCLAWALTQEEVDGIWGGSTEGERRAMRPRPVRRVRRRSECADMSRANSPAGLPCPRHGVTR
ncbi:WhiB family transcriptional regulator [Streptomyces zhihengii]|uniref:WhiB family transcriptional regulator n=1 Tax=Streptomyces zhihengii TaxID=1818004 RepID=UPI003F4C4542